MGRDSFQYKDFWKTEISIGFNANLDTGKMSSLYWGGHLDPYRALAVKIFTSHNICLIYGRFCLYVQSIT